MTERASYVHALRFRWLNRLYDPVVRWTTRERRFKRLLTEQVAAGSGRVLDLGCGTGTLTVLLKQQYPDADIVGLDGDPEVLTIAARKAAAAGVAVTLRHGLADQPPFEDRAFDRVVSSLMFHHLDRAAKERAPAKVRGLLVAGGELHIADWGRAQNALMRIAFTGVQILDGFDTTRDNVQGKLIDMMVGAGFEAVQETHRLMTMFGTLSLYRAHVPRDGHSQ